MPYSQSLRQRLLELEARAPQADEERKLRVRAAVRAIFDRIEELRPATAEGRIYGKPSVWEVARAWAGRHSAGTLTAADQELVSTLPADALRVFGTTGERFLLRLAQVGQKTAA